jgi:hypothetical protein
VQPLANDLSTLGPASCAYLGTRHSLFIGGRFVESIAGETVAAIDPSSGLKVSRVPAGDASDIDSAVRSARKAFDEAPWRKMAAPEQERITLKLADLLESHALSGDCAGNTRKGSWHCTCVGTL